jgi:heptosyltransferase-2
MPLSVPVTRILIIKFGALGDVLRTTSILAGLHQNHGDAHIEWVTATAARELVAGHGSLASTHAIDPKSAREIKALGDQLEGNRWDWVISLDDEQLPCELATRLGNARRTGAFLDESGHLMYTDDSAPWFEMGLISRLGKQEADRLKVANTRSQPEIYAEMLGIEMGRPELPLSPEAIDHAQGVLAAEHPGRKIGLNTGAGGRWTSKALPVERVIELALGLKRVCPDPLTFIVLGGADEAERNREILSGLDAAGLGSQVVDGGSDNSLLEFASIIDRLDLLVTSDSLALHMGVSRNVPVVAFFAPTSAAEIELYGLGRKVLSQGADYCSYRPDADNSTITAARLIEAAYEVLQLPSND